MFYVEQLPEQFNVMYNDISKTDLAFVIVTPLHVYPFSSLIYKVPTNNIVVSVN